MHLIEDVTDLKKKGVELNLAKATLASTKATMIPLLYTVLRKLVRVVRNQKRNNDNLKLVATRVSTLEDPLVLESASDSMADYPLEEFTEESEEDGTVQAEGGEDGDEESVGDHEEGDHDDAVEGYVKRVEPEGSEYQEGDD